MIFARTSGYWTVIHVICSKPRRGFQLGNLEERNEVLRISEENATSEISIADDVPAVHYKSKRNRKQQLTRHHVVENDDSKGLSKDWCTDVHIPESMNSTRKSSYPYYPTSNLCWTAF